jgi:hypothetical protein
MWYVSDIYTMGVQYGLRTELCDFLTNSTWYANGTYNYAEFAKYAIKKAEIDDYDAVELAKTDILSPPNAIR